MKSQQAYNTKSPLRRFTSALGLLGLLMLLSTLLRAQEQPTDWEEPTEEGVQGEIDNAQFVVVKDREITLPVKSRKFNKVPPLPVQQGGEQVQYNFLEVEQRFEKIKPVIKPLKAKPKPLDKLYANYLRAWFGNFGGLGVDLFLNNKRSKYAAYGLNLQHAGFSSGPVDGGNSGSTRTQVEGNARFFSKAAEIGISAGYDRQRVNFFGYAPTLTDVSEDTLRQIWNKINIKAHLQSTEVDNPLQFRAEGAFQSTSNDFDASEVMGRVSLKSSYQLDDPLSIYFNGSLMLSQYEVSNQQNRNLIKVQPGVRYQTGDLTLYAGINAAQENDTLPDADQLHIYPNLKAEYQISEQVLAKAFVDGDIEERTLWSLSEENPWIAEGVALAHQNRELAIGASLEAGIGAQAFLEIGASYASYRNAQLITNDRNDSTRFMAIYEPELNQLKLYAGIDWQISSTLQSKLALQFYNYDAAVLGEALGRPTYELNWQTTINLYEKIYLKPGLQVMGGITALAPQTGDMVTLDAITDLSLQADYIISPRAAGWLRLNNLIGGEYERWLNYPARNLQIGLGVTYRF